jgi:hypothetical protein
MKHVAMLFALLLALGLLTACGKAEPEALYDDDLKGKSNTTNYCVIYEADWVLDRQVIDKTVIRLIDNQRLEIDHMPNEVLLKNVSEIQGLPVFDSSRFTCSYEYLAYADKSLYVGAEESNSMSFTVSEDYRSGNYYLVKVGEEEYAVGLDYQTDGTYNQNTDQWTLKWTVSRVNLHEANSPSSVMFGYTFDPALTLILISTKRLN